MANEEYIGFYKGCINTLLGERTALIEMINNVDKLIQVNMEELKKLGVDVDSMVKQGQATQGQQGQHQQPQNLQTSDLQTSEPEKKEEKIEFYEQEERIP